MTACRGIRGATTADANTEEAIHAATTELVQELIDANGLEEDSLAAAFFTITTEIIHEFNNSVFCAIRADLNFSFAGQYIENF